MDVALSQGARSILRWHNLELSSPRVDWCLKWNWWGLSPEYFFLVSFWFYSTLANQSSGFCHSETIATKVNISWLPTGEYAMPCLCWYGNKWNGLWHDTTLIRIIISLELTLHQSNELNEAATAARHLQSIYLSIYLSLVFALCLIHDQSTVRWRDWLMSSLRMLLIHVSISQRCQCIY